VAYSEYILIKAECSEALEGLLLQGCRVAYDLGVDGRVLYLVPNAIPDLLARDAVYAAVKHELFARDEPTVIRYHSRGVSWFQFHELKGDGHLKVVIRRIKHESLDWYSVSLAYGSFYTNENGENLKPHTALVALYKKTTSALKKKSRKETFGAMDLFVSRKISESFGNEYRNVIYRFLYP
jgi:hypothetical protein